MKTVLLFGLGLSCFLSADASPTPMWPDCANVSTNFEVTSAGGSFESVGCKFSSPFINVTFPDTLPVGTLASIFISNGWVGPGINTGIGLVGPSFEAATAMGPLQLTVSSMAFAQDAVLRFTGALPPKSSLSITGNTFYQAQSNANSGMNDLLAAITLGVPSGSLLLSSYTTVVVSENSFQVVGANTNYAAINLLYQSVVISGSSSVNMSGNAVSNSVLTNIGSASVISWQVTTDSASSGPLAVADKSSLILNNNTMTNSTISGISGEAGWTIASAVNLKFSVSTRTFRYLIENSSSVVVAGNVISDSIMSGKGAVAATISLTFYGGDRFVVDGRSNFEVDENAIQNVSGLTIEVVNLILSQLTRGLTVSNSSSFRMNRNRISAVSNVNSLLSVVSFSPSNAKVFISGGSKLSSDVNVITNTSAGTIQHTYWTFTNASVTLSSGSTLSLSGNTIDNTTTNGVVSVSFFNLANSDVFISESLVTFSANTISNSSFKTFSVYIANWLLINSNLRAKDQSTVTLSGNGISNAGFWLMAEYVAAQIKFSNEISSSYIQVLNSSVFLSNNYASSMFSNGNVFAAKFDMSALVSAAVTSGSISMNGNIIDSGYSNLGAYACLVAFPNEVAISNASMETNENAIRSSTTGLSAIAVSWGAFATDFNVSASVLMVNNNSVTDSVVNELYVFACEVPVALTLNSTFAVDNSVVDNSNSSSVNIAYFSTFASITVSTGTMFAVRNSRVSITSTSAPVSILSVLSQPGVSLSGLLSVQFNTVEAPSAVDFSLVNLKQDFTADPGMSVVTCNNTLSWDSTCYNYPAKYLSPVKLADLSTLCAPPLPTTTSKSQQPSDDKSKAGLIAGATVSSVLGVAAIIGGFLVYRKRRMSTDETPTLMGQEAQAKYGGVQI